MMTSVLVTAAIVRDPAAVGDAAEHCSGERAGPAGSDHEHVGAEGGGGVGDAGHDVAVGAVRRGVQAGLAGALGCRVGDVLGAVGLLDFKQRRAGARPRRPHGQHLEPRSGLLGEVDRDVERLPGRIAAVGGDQDGLHGISPLSAPLRPWREVTCRASRGCAWRRHRGGARNRLRLSRIGVRRSDSPQPARGATPMKHLPSPARVVVCGTADARRRSATITHREESIMRRWLQYGGFAAGIVLIVFGIVAIFMGANGRSTVHDSLRQEQIVGSADMTPVLIAAAVKEAGLKDVSLPSCSVAGKSIDTGDRARCFASYMRIHALEASSGLSYSQMPRYASADGKGTSDEAAAVKSDSGRPVDNPVRAVWVSETAFATALNVSYMADQLALFGVVVGVALLLSGIGFIVLAAFGMLRLGAGAVPAGPSTPADTA
jgi:hypothetical protein